MGHDLPEAQGGGSMVSRVRDMIAATEVMIELQRKILGTAVALTTPNDWKNLDGKPYCTADGCNRAASHMPLKSWFVSEPKRTNAEDDLGGYYIYSCTVGVAWKTGLGEVTAMGTCSSRDRFFSMRDGQRKPMEEIDETNIIKKCATNGKGNALRSLFGFGNLTWERLEDLGIPHDQVEAVKYDGKGGGKKDENPEASEATRDKIRAMVLEMNNQDPRAAEADLERITAWVNKKNEQVPGKRNVKHITEKALPIALGKVQAEHAKWKKAQPPEKKPETAAEFSPPDCPNDRGTKPDPKVCANQCRDRKGCPEWEAHDKGKA